MLKPEDESEECSSDDEIPHREDSDVPKTKNISPGALKLCSWLNKSFRVEMSDGRVLLGVFLCTDRDRNIILGSCSEYLPPKNDIKTNESPEDPRALGLVMIPGKHIVSIHLDQLDINAPSLPDEDI